MIRCVVLVIVAATLLGAAGAWWALYAPRQATVQAPQVVAMDQPLGATRAGTVAPSASPALGPAWFTEVTDATGIDFRHQSGTNAEKPFPAANGSGVAAFDYDLDGHCDLYFATGTPFPMDPSRSEPTNRCYRNRGDWNFEEVTAHTGLGHAGFSAGLAVGDYDSDGFPDVYVTCYGANCLYRNLGDGTFERVEKSAGVADERWATSAAFLDYDADGNLDLYVCNYAKWTWEMRRYCGDRVRNVQIYCSPSSVDPEDDVLFRNRGDGGFDDVTASSGVGVPAGRGQGVVAADFNEDGWIDLYVANDLNPNFLFLNRGDGTFRDASEFSGAAYDFQGRAQAGMGVDAADFNRDGRLDLFVTNFQAEHNTLYENLGGDLYQDASHRNGVAAESIPWVGWGTALCDFDLDGWLDLVVTNGHVDDNRHLLGQDAPYASPPLAWRNARGRFVFLGAQGGPFFAERRVGRGLAVADFDNDGDEDVVIVHQDDRPALLRNDRLRNDRLAPKATERGAVTVRLVGTGSNRDAIGAVVRLSEGGASQMRPVKGGGSYLSASERQLVFAMPEEPSVSLDIVWPNRTRSQVAVEAGGKVVVIEPRDRQTNHLTTSRRFPYE